MPDSHQPRQRHCQFSNLRHNPGSLSLRSLSMRLPIALLLLASLAACTWVPMAPEGKTVRVLPPGQAPAGCEKRGEVVVSVKSSVGFYQRNPLRVREELETLARNEAPGVGANTVQAMGEPVDGDQRYAAYQCSSR